MEKPPKDPTTKMKRFLTQLSPRARHDNTLRKEVSVDALGGSSVGSLSPVWLKQRLEREWMRAEYAEEELQATRARRDAADTQIKNLKSAVARYGAMLVEADKEITRLSAHVEAKEAELSASQQQLQMATDWLQQGAQQLEAGKAVTAALQMQYQDSIRTFRSVSTELERMFGKAGKALEMCSTAIPESLQHGHLTADCISGMYLSCDILKMLTALQPKVASVPAWTAGHRTPLVTPRSRDMTSTPTALSAAAWTAPSSAALTSEQPAALSTAQTGAASSETSAPAAPAAAEIEPAAAAAATEIEPAAAAAAESPEPRGLEPERSASCVSPHGPVGASLMASLSRQPSAISSVASTRNNNNNSNLARDILGSAINRNSPRTSLSGTRSPRWTCVSDKVAAFERGTSAGETQPSGVGLSRSNSTPHAAANSPRAPLDLSALTTKIPAAPVGATSSSSGVNSPRVWTTSVSECRIPAAPGAKQPPSNVRTSAGAAQDKTRNKTHPVVPSLQLAALSGAPPLAVEAKVQAVAAASKASDSTSSGSTQKSVAAEAAAAAGTKIHTALSAGTPSALQSSSSDNASGTPGHSAGTTDVVGAALSGDGCATQQQPDHNSSESMSGLTVTPIADTSAFNALGRLVSVGASSTSSGSAFASSFSSQLSSYNSSTASVGAKKEVSSTQSTRRSVSESAAHITQHATAIVQWLATSGKARALVAAVLLPLLAFAMLAAMALLPATPLRPLRHAYAVLFGSSVGECPFQQPSLLASTQSGIVPTPPGGAP